jgi:hypothetical protein
VIDVTLLIGTWLRKSKCTREILGNKVAAVTASEEDSIESLASNDDISQCSERNRIPRSSRLYNLSTDRVDGLNRVYKG